MMGPSRVDAVVIGAGPNGLAAAVTLARAGRSVKVLEAADRIGGGTRTEELTLPGFAHDVCSAIHPLGAGSPFFAELPLARHGLEWIHPPVAVAHPFTDGPAASLSGSVEDTAVLLGRDGDRYRALLGPSTRDWPKLARMLLAPPRLPRYPLAAARFGVRAVRSASSVVERSLETREARGLFAGIAAHSTLPLEVAGSSAFGFVLAAAGHVHGWPLPRGGSQRIADALAAHLATLGGTIEVGRRVTRFDALPPADAYLFDLSPAQLLRIAGSELPVRYRRHLRSFRYGPGVFKIDWALSGPIPWSAEVCRRAGTVHLGNTAAEVAASERAVWAGRHPERPFTLLAQPSLFDSSRAPSGNHTAWAYCHVPQGSTRDMTAPIEAQVERHAPGFRSRILARHTLDTAAMERRNPNLVGGDISGGVLTIPRLLARPAPRFPPYSTPHPKIFLCSSSTPPGGGVHGMCGYHAAQAALKRCW